MYKKEATKILGHILAYLTHQNIKLSIPAVTSWPVSATATSSPSLTTFHRAIPQVSGSRPLVNRLSPQILVYFNTTVGNSKVSVQRMEDFLSAAHPTSVDRT